MSSSTSAVTAQAASSPEDSKSTDYQAPYHQIDPAYKDHYIITFKQGYTLVEHFAFLEKEIEAEGSLDDCYLAKLDRPLFETVRGDPGVELIEDNSLGEWGPSEEELVQALRRKSQEERAT